MSDCARFRPWRWEFLDAELEMGARVAFELHLAICNPCRRARQIDAAFLDLLARQSHQRAAPASLRARVAQLASGH